MPALANGKRFTIRWYKISSKLFQLSNTPHGMLLFSSICCIESDHLHSSAQIPLWCVLGHTQHIWLWESGSPAMEWRTAPWRMQPEQNPARIADLVTLHIFTPWPLAQPCTAGRHDPQYFRNLSQKNLMKVGAGRKTKMKLTLLRN